MAPNRTIHHEILEKLTGRLYIQYSFEEFNAGCFIRPIYLIVCRNIMCCLLATNFYRSHARWRGMSSKPLFDNWPKQKPTARCFENFWKKWGFLLLGNHQGPRKAPSAFYWMQTATLLNAESIDTFSGGCE